MELQGHTFTVAGQMSRFLCSILLGLPAGLLLDCFRTLRALLPHHALLVFLEDTVYVFLCIFTVQCYVWMYADGVFRWQYAAGACIGLAVYLVTVGAVWMRMLSRLRTTARRISGALRRRSALLIYRIKESFFAKKSEKPLDE
ncbi:MAG: spore cortex biosynthesis protein YabQ [Oscillospiraceae bacterium]|nr:spore cortex biosynthesis protein YabQ [Oscillospiraceae bacterium]